MLPISDVWTMTICGGVATKARIDTISSTAFLENESALCDLINEIRSIPKRRVQ